MKINKGVVVVWVGGALFGMALPAAFPAWADDVTMRPYISESLMYSFSDKRRSDGGIGGMLGGGMPVNRWFNLELDGAYSHFNANKDSGSEPWQEYFAKVDGQYVLDRNPQFEPYVGVGLGWVKESLKNVGNDDAFMADAGVGAYHFFKIFNADFAVRGDVRYRWADTKSARFPGRDVGHIGEPVVSLGLIIPLSFGGAPAAAQPVELPPAPPPPPPPAPALNPNQSFENIHFAFDKSALTPYSQSSLDSDAAVINKLSASFPNLKVDISGHTDWIGTDAYNQALSERRANVVRDYLVRKGVDAGRTRVFAYGETEPVAPNTTAEGRALNRRTEIRTHNGE